MYFLVLFLDVLGALIIVGIIRNFAFVNDTLPLAIFFCLFPLAFATLSEFIKLQALRTGTGSDYRGMVRIVGILLILITLGFGAYPPFMLYWNQPKHDWNYVILVILAIEALVLIALPIIKGVRSRATVDYDKLHEDKIA